MNAVSNIFSESMNRLDLDDDKKSLQLIENYINYMCERIDHAINNVAKRAAELGSDTMLTDERLKDMESDISIIASSLSSTEAKANAAVSTANNARDSVNAMGTTVSALSTAVGDLQTNVGNLSSAVDTLITNYTALEARVRALEER